MKIIFPPKLKKGDEVRIIAPAASLEAILEKNIKKARNALIGLGLKVSFGKNASERDIIDSSKTASRISDFHEAFFDQSVNAILCCRGGYSSNSLLDYLDYGLIRKNLKILCGYSDITAIANAITSKTGVATYSGLNFSTFAMDQFHEYNIEYFKKCLFESAPYEVKPAEVWTDDKWYLEDAQRNPIKNLEFLAINEGEAEGRILGGNLGTFILLKGTPYFPDIKNSILFLEEDNLAGVATAKVFDRNLQSLIHLPEFAGVKGIVIGRFQTASEMTREKIMYIIKSKKELETIPVIANVDFGHTDQMITFPIGGIARISVREKSKIEILNH